MKSLQWVGAIVVLALVVFAITFAMNYLGEDRPPPQAAQPDKVPRLTFYTGKVVPEDGPPLESELGRPGQQDYWFVNATGQNLPIGMIGKSCTCTSVELFVPSDRWQKQLPAQSGALLGLLTVPRPAELEALVGAWNEGLARQAQATDPVPLTTASSEVVPAGAVGWVRLKWKADRVELRALRVELWMGQEGAGATDIITGVRITEPMMSDRDVSVGTFVDRETPREAALTCWSTTRPHFRVKGRVIRPEKMAAKSDALQIGEPVPLSETDCRKMEAKLQVRQVLSGYRIPLRLLAKSPDESNPIDLGPFHRYVELSSDDLDIAPIQVSVTGVVLGDVKVGTKSDGALHFGSFRSSKGSNPRSILLQTDMPGVELQLDHKRVPRFVKVDFPEKPDVAPSGHRVWRLEARILPKQALGSFPRQDDPAFQDSAIYVKMAGPHPRAIRIPLVGTANED